MESITIDFIKQSFPMFLLREQAPKGWLLNLNHIEEVTPGMEMDAQKYAGCVFRIEEVFEKRPAKGDFSHPAYNGVVPTFYRVRAVVIARYKPEENKK
jgi:hypothetical protein